MQVTDGVKFTFFNAGQLSQQLCPITGVSKVTSSRFLKNCSKCGASVCTTAFFSGIRFEIALTPAGIVRLSIRQL